MMISAPKQIGEKRPFIALPDSDIPMPDCAPIFRGNHVASAVLTESVSVLFIMFVIHLYLLALLVVHHAASRSRHDRRSGRPKRARSASKRTLPSLG